MLTRLCNKLYPLLLVSLTLSLQSFGQKQANVWYFGNKVGLDFNYSPPKLLTDGKITFDEKTTDTESAASICDENGNLLLYTDGVTVWNRDQQVIPGGTDLWGNNTTTQTLIVPRPEDPSLFYIFTASPQADDEFFPKDKKGFRYSTVDLLTDSVTSKNVLLNKSTTEKIAGTLHANGRDVWVVMHEWNNNVFRAYLVTKDGIADPVISTAGSVHEGTSNQYNDNAIGQMKISPNGNLLALAIYKKGLVELFHFDPSNGQVNFWASMSNFSDTERVYGIEFAKSSTVLYVTTVGCNIYQFDLESNNIAQSQVTLATNAFPVCDFSSQLQLGPDGKIYVIKEGSNLGTIMEPDKKGVGCDYESQHINLPGDGVHYFKDGLPNFISSFFYKPDLYPPRPYFEMPNVFTPNADGHNDLFQPISHYNVDEANLSVFNRWGQLVYVSDKPEWEGTGCSAGTYYWRISYRGSNGKDYTQKGFVYLER